MVSAEICPPPKTVEKKLGEVRVFNYHGVGVSIGEELNTKEIVGGIQNKDEKAQALSDAAFKAVNALYKPLEEIVEGKREPGPEFTQPWKDGGMPTITIFDPEQESPVKPGD